MHRCSHCDRKTDPLTEHRSEVELVVFCADCCPGSCDSLTDHYR